MAGDVQSEERSIGELLARLGAVVGAARVGAGHRVGLDCAASRALAHLIAERRLARDELSERMLLGDAETAALLELLEHEELVRRCSPPDGLGGVRWTPTASGRALLVTIVPAVPARAAA